MKVEEVPLRVSSMYLCVCVPYADSRDTNGETRQLKFTIIKYTENKNLVSLLWRLISQIVLSFILRCPRQAGETNVRLHLSTSPPENSKIGRQPPKVGLKTKSSQRFGPLSHSRIYVYSPSSDSSPYKIFTILIIIKPAKYKSFKTAKKAVTFHGKQIARQTNPPSIFPTPPSPAYPARPPPA